MPSRRGHCPAVWNEVGLRGAGCTARRHAWMAVAPTCLAPVRAALLRATRGRWLAPSLKVWPSGQWRGISSAASMAEVVVGMKRARSVVQSEISLTPQEAAVCKTLSDAKEFAGSETVIRIVGGWVRDKVLGMESDDIDIALDDVSGADFAERVLAYLKAQGVETSKLAVIERNPEQSKHLETATMKVEGVSVDFVGLRAEEYAAGSRIPEVRLGTAEEDALRRDLTINALFYRVDTGAIEDLTGRGLDGACLSLHVAQHRCFIITMCPSLTLDRSADAATRPNARRFASGRGPHTAGAHANIHR